MSVSGLFHSRELPSVVYEPRSLLRRIELGIKISVTILDVIRLAYESR